MNNNGNKDSDERNNDENDPGIANSRKQLSEAHCANRVLTVAVT